MSWITAVGLLAAICTTFSFIPQVARIVKLKETKDISLMMYVILDIGIALWFIYGLMIHDLPVILANGVGMVLTSTILFFKLRYG